MSIEQKMSGDDEDEEVVQHIVQPECTVPIAENDDIVCSYESLLITF